MAVLCAASAWAGQDQRPKWKRAWIISAAAMTAASLLDAHSSQGLPETNPLLRNSQGQFSMGRGYALKAGATVGMAFIQALTARRRPELYKPCAVLNSAAAGALGAVAWRNRSLRGR